MPDCGGMLFLQYGTLLRIIPWESIEGLPRSKESSREYAQFLYR